MPPDPEKKQVDRKSAPLGGCYGTEIDEKCIKHVSFISCHAGVTLVSRWVCLGTGLEGRFVAIYVIPDIFSCAVSLKMLPATEAHGRVPRVLPLRGATMVPKAAKLTSMEAGGLSK